MYTIIRNINTPTEKRTPCCYLLDNAIGLARDVFNSEGKKHNDTITVVNRDNKIIKTFK
jgi:hypothetical protein